jgi:cytochrome c peroxidase
VLALAHRNTVARALVLTIGFTVLAGSIAGRSDEQPTSREPVSRDQVWRQIFTKTAAPPDPENNISTPGKIALGFMLFRDPRLSRDGSLSCASCHQPDRAFTDGLPKAVARDGGPLPRNTPSLLNAAWGKHFFWDGRAASLEEQAKQPLTDAREMAVDFALAVKQLSEDHVAASLFSRAFREAPNVSEDNILKALAAYERTLVSPGSAFDRWVAGDDKALTDDAQRGFSIFVGKGGCVGCHGGWRMTDDSFHDIGLPGDDPGRSTISGGIAGALQFKTPGLRELTKTAPYMHDGSLPTLRSVIDHYAGGHVKRPSLDTNFVRDLTLTEAEKADLEAFLKSASAP